MKEYLKKNKAQFGTAPVFFTAISTILGAIMFLRFGYAVGHTGFVGVLAIIIIGHIVTITTALSIAEIATNQKVEGGGEYYIISRSFGLNIGASIGVALYFSQAISVAFYIIAMVEAFDPLMEFVHMKYGIPYLDKRLLSLPILGFMALLMLTKGAKLGMQALYFVVAILFIGLIMFFAGDTSYFDGFVISRLATTVEPNDDFFKVFAIVFPAFTGMTAGVGLSGNLKDPSKSIPYGTILATLVGMAIYILIALKLALYSSPEDLATDQMVMGQIALWGPIIPIGLAAATFSSALGSMMVAPRTMQAIASDRIMPFRYFNYWLSRGGKKRQEPINATLITCLIAVFFLLIGDIDFVASVISMFFMVTYGSICLISFLEHLSANPSYRPVFKSTWYFSLLGTVMCIWLMFKMNSAYAFLAILIMASIYLFITYTKKEKEGLAAIFQGVIFQVSRRLQVFLQKSNRNVPDVRWRPSMVVVSRESFKRFAAFDLLRWISYKYGFGTYIHLMTGYLSRHSNKEANLALSRLINMAENSKSNVYLDVIVSPSYTSAIAQVLQLPGISGKENNIILFEFSKQNPSNLDDILDNFRLVKAIDFDVCILGSSEKGFGFHNEIHIWITPTDYKNANLMILMGYILLGHPEWSNGQIKIFAVYPKDSQQEQKDRLSRLIQTGRLPISPNNIELIPYSEDDDIRDTINIQSKDADLTIMGFWEHLDKEDPKHIFLGFEGIGNVLFVNTTHEKDLV